MLGMVVPKIEYMQSKKNLTPPSLCLPLSHSSPSPPPWYRHHTYIQDRPTQSDSFTDIKVLLVNSRQVLTASIRCETPSMGVPPGSIYEEGTD